MCHNYAKALDTDRKLHQNIIVPMLTSNDKVDNYNVQQCSENYVMKQYETYGYKPDFSQMSLWSYSLK